MAIPDQLKIGHLVYSVVFQEEVWSSEGAQCWGAASYDRQTLYFMNKMPLDRLVEVLLHEIAHAIWSGTTMSGTKKLPEEAVASIMGAGYAQVFLDNPGLTKFILDATKDLNRGPGQDWFDKTTEGTWGKT